MASIERDCENMRNLKHNMLLESSKDPPEDGQDNNTCEITNLIKLSCKRSTQEEKTQGGGILFVQLDVSVDVTQRGI